ncbi:MAG: laccase domain-containing protein, partial [Terriglobia bacterium]
LDLIAVALDQLKSAGVPRSHISVAEFCTSCRNDLFFSARREGQRTGRMIAAIGVRRSYRRRTESGKQTVNAE